MQDIIFKEVSIASPEYEQVWQLREDVLRQPLGMSLKDEDLSMDAEDIICIALHDDTVIACLMLHPLDNAQIKLRQMAVAFDWQGKDIGRSLVQEAECIAADYGYNKIVLHAREVAIGFYSKLHYTITSDLFTEVGIPHVVMEKEL